MKHFETLIRSPALPARHVIIWLHGLGASGHDFADIVDALKLPEALAIKFIFPHAPVRKVTLNQGLSMPAWFDIYGLSPDSDIDYSGIQTSNEILHALIEEEIKGGIPADKIILAGFSQGGALALYSGLHYPHRLAGIMGLSTFLPPLVFTPPVQPKEVRIFMAHGSYDPVVMPLIGEASKQYLNTIGYQVDWHWYAMPHYVCPEEIQDIAGWIRRCFGE